MDPEMEHERVEPRLAEWGYRAIIGVLQEDIEQVNATISEIVGDDFSEAPRLLRQFAFFLASDAANLRTEKHGGDEAAAVAELQAYLRTIALEG